ncbi:MAG: hypothetical protein A2W91_08930 [Bacteroidetes bacterium GWF2_38_335]|nr:MAG: hypothetical protein A2W91_08930 [Bacteroidetes bacterium GWF2_38_335]OFY80496.1 MAG: hypothetical protein A2281_08655 [Bacteroidetes bacterium RIFOXYA12_FULL_38_20]HBS85895.1 hypothetical protein [Bacteroidales bacterium]
MRILIIFIIFIQSIFSAYAQLEYISPVPGSKFHNPETTIILRKSGTLDTTTVSQDYFTIHSNFFGQHEFDLVFSTDGKTVILKPITEFAFEDTVNVWISKDFFGAAEDLSFTFFTRKVRASDKNTFEEKSVMDSLPPNFPDLLIYQDSSACDQQVFMHNISAFSTNHDRFMTIMNNDGSLIYTKQDDDEGVGFTLQESGYISYWGPGEFIIIDSAYQPKDTFHCMDGYSTDWHEFVHLSTGHAFVISYDPHEMLVIIEDDTIGTSFVEGFVFQELDADKNVILLWRSWDHFKISDATHTDFTNLLLAYVHGNALAVANDGNILISSRKLDEITKINRNTGNIIWRLGGKNNQFEFINDTMMFNRQHHITQLENGNITLFDNGEFHHKKISYAKEYKLNEINRTAELVWSFQHPDSIFSSKMGSVQRLPNGNTFICWGLLNLDGNPHITEVDSANNIVYEIKINEPYNYLYRAFKFPWHPANINVPEFSENEMQIKYYPNPASDYFTIETPVEIDFYQLDLYDISGTLCISSFVKSNPLIVNTSNLPAGLYFISLKGNKINHSFKLSVIR